MADIFDGKKIVCDFLHILLFAPQKEDFKAVVLVEMYMDCGDDVVVMLMLDVVQFFRKVACVMAVDECERANHISFRAAVSSCTSMSRMR